MSRKHHCHALGCERDVPPRMHMCSKHWAMVPKRLQKNLWANYRRGQENDMCPTADYLKAAAACVRSVAEQEDWPPAEIEADVALYTEWAEMVEDL